MENRWIAPIGHDALIKGWLPHFTRVAEGVLGIPHALPVMLIAPLAAIMVQAGLRQDARKLAQGALALVQQGAQPQQPPMEAANGPA